MTRAMSHTKQLTLVGKKCKREDLDDVWPHLANVCIGTQILSSSGLELGWGGGGGSALSIIIVWTCSLTVPPYKVISRRSILLCNQGHVVKDEWWAIWIRRLRARSPCNGNHFSCHYFLNRAS